MRRVFLMSVVFGIFCVCSSLLQAAEYPWKLRVDRDGIVIHTRRVEGSPILEFKGKLILEAPIEKAITLYEDAAKMKTWFHQCVLAELVADEGPLSKVYYLAMHLPWPVSERDTVFRAIKSIDPSTGEIAYSLSSVLATVPLNPRRIRVPYLKTSWHFKPLADGRTEIDFQQHSEAGGFIPAPIVNKLVIDIPFNSLKNFRQRIVEAGKKQTEKVLK